MVSNLRKFLNLGSTDKWMFCHGLILLPAVTILLRLLGLNRSLSILSGLQPHKLPYLADPSELPLKKAYRIAWLVDVTSRYTVIRANCLHRSLVLWFLLKRQGIDSELHFGARKKSGKFEAHAWVELFGRVLNDSEDVRNIFTPFDRATDPGSFLFQ